jgi:hypothetical protein
MSGTLISRSPLTAARGWVSWRRNAILFGHCCAERYALRDRRDCCWLSGNVFPRKPWCKHRSAPLERPSRAGGVDQIGCRTLSLVKSMTASESITRDPYREILGDAAARAQNYLQSIGERHVGVTTEALDRLLMAAESSRPSRSFGWTQGLLEAAVEYACQRGAKIVEGYPQDIQKDLPSAFVWTGLLPTFRRAG